MERIFLTKMSPILPSPPGIFFLLSSAMRHLKPPSLFPGPSHEKGRGAYGESRLPVRKTFMRPHSEKDGRGNPAFPYKTPWTSCARRPGPQNPVFPGGKHAAAEQMAGVPISRLPPRRGTGCGGTIDLTRPEVLPSLYAAPADRPACAASTFSIDRYDAFPT